MVATSATCTFSGCETASCDTGFTHSDDGKAGNNDGDVETTVVESNSDDDALQTTTEAQIRSRFPEV